MRRLHRRIHAVGDNQDHAMGAYHPATAPATPMSTPLAQVTYTPNQSYPWGTLTYQELHPVWAADGALIAGSVPYPPVVVHPAGR